MTPLLRRVYAISAFFNEFFSGDFFGREIYTHNIRKIPAMENISKLGF